MPYTIENHTLKHTLMLALLKGMNSRELICCFQQNQYVEEIPLVVYKRHSKFIYKQCLQFFYEYPKRIEWGLHYIDHLVGEIVLKLLRKKASEINHIVFEDYINVLVQAHLKKWEQQTVLTIQVHQSNFTFEEQGDEQVNCVHLKRTNLTLEQLQEATQIADTLLFEAINKLSHQEALCIQAFYIERKSVTEIAEIYSFHEAKVWKFLKSGKRQLCSMLESNIQEEHTKKGNQYIETEHTPRVANRR